MDDLPEQLRGLTGYQNNASQMGVLMKAAEEIERLRASQFRWMPVGELVEFEHEDEKKEFFMAKNGRYYGAVPWKDIVRHGATHWAPIPPLPEKSQEEKDEELWVAYIGTNPQNVHFMAKSHFLAGLKAARDAVFDKWDLRPKP